MIGKLTILAPAVVSLAITAAAPQIAKAGEPERLQFHQCLADGALKPNENWVRSECMWKHWSYMASYGP